MESQTLGGFDLACLCVTLTRTSLVASLISAFALPNLVQPLLPMVLEAVSTTAVPCRAREGPVICPMVAGLSSHQVVLSTLGQPVRRHETSTDEGRLAITSFMETPSFYGTNAIMVSHSMTLDRGPAKCLPTNQKPLFVMMLSKMLPAERGRLMAGVARGQSEVSVSLPPDGKPAHVRDACYRVLPGRSSTASTTERRLCLARGVLRSGRQEDAGMPKRLATRIVERRPMFSIAAPLPKPLVLRLQQIKDKQSPRRAASVRRAPAGPHPMHRAPGLPQKDGR